MRSVRGMGGGCGVGVAPARHWVLLAYSPKSFKKKGSIGGEPPDDPGNPNVDSHGAKRSNATHESSTDPEARLARKGAGKEAKLTLSGHVLMGNRNGLCLDISISHADGHAERREALRMLKRQKKLGFLPTTLGADKGYDTACFVHDVYVEGVIPHVARKRKHSNIDAPLARQVGYRHSQRCRKKVEEIFGWMKTVGGLRKTPYRGVERSTAPTSLARRTTCWPLAAAREHGMSADPRCTLMSATAAASPSRSARTEPIRQRTDRRNPRLRPPAT